MAKQTVKEFTFDELDTIMTKIDPRGSTFDRNTYSKITERIHSGNYMLNAQLSGSLRGGYANARTYVLAGENSVGKSFLALNACKNAQKYLGYNIIYMDSEAAMDIDTIKKFGLDPSKVRYQPVVTVKEARHFISNLCSSLKEKKEKGMSIPKLMLVLDSIGNLATDKEREDSISGSEKKDMTKQQDIRSLFRVITMELAELKIPFLITAHVYSSISFIGGNEVSGGGGLKYIGSTIIELSKAQLKEKLNPGEDERQTGIIVTSKIKKNRFAKPHKIRFHISFYKGMNPYVGLEEFISWDNCGIDRGKIITENEFKKEYEGKNDETSKYIASTKFIFKEGDKERVLYFEPNDTAKTFAVKHLGTHIKPRDLFTPNVFTDEVIDMLDEKVIRPYFELPDIIDDNSYDIDEFIDENE
jgi:RecA/RadA recombinase